MALFPKGTQVICLKTDFGHVTEIALPVSYLDERKGKPWDSFRFNIAVDDYDTPEDKGSRVWWRPDWRSQQNYAGSGTFKR